MNDASATAERGSSFEPPEKILERLRNPAHLATLAEISQAFKPTDKPQAVKWHNFCFNEQNPIYELFTREYLIALSGYLVQRGKELKSSPENPIIILEVGAGNGKLSHFLRQFLDEREAREFKVIATDTGSDPTSKLQFPVEQIDYAKALKKYNPAIVLSSWMPYGEDWTRDFRATSSVKEYLLVGEPDGVCGDYWQTWGIPDFNPAGKNDSPPYIRGGFERFDLDELSKNQIGRTSEPGKYYKSTTVSFRRREPEKRSFISKIYGFKSI